MHKVLSESDMVREVKRAKIVNYIVLALLLSITLAIIVGFLVYRSQHTFQQARWLDEPSERTDMIDDLLRTHNLIGLTESEVLSLLGPNSNDQGAFTADNRYVYYLGPERGLFSIDSEWLLIDFSNGIVSDYSLTTD